MKNMGSLGVKFVNFDQKLKNTGSLGDRATLSGVFECVSWKGGVLRALHSIPLKMGIPPEAEQHFLDKEVKITHIVLFKQEWIFSTNIAKSQLKFVIQMSNKKIQNIN